MTVKVFIEDMQVTLFSDEGVSITSSVLDIEDITVNTTDYSKTFTVPANEQNNYLFKHYYNADIDNLFDARITHNGRIELDNFVFRTGKFVLRSVNVKQGVASSYTINFWGNLVSLKDLIGEDYLSDLDLSFFDHNYSDAAVRQGLQTEVANKDGAMIYTPIAKKQYYYESGVSEPENDASANIAYNGATGGNGINWDELKPSLKLIKILETIETQYGITFTRDFFGTSTFTELYMWLNNDAELDEMGGRETDILFTSGNSPYIGGGTGIYPAEYSNYPTENNPPDADTVRFDLNLVVTPSAGYEDIPYTIRCRNHSLIPDNVVSQRSIVGRGNLSASIVWQENFNPTAQVTWSIECSKEFEYSASLSEQRVLSGINSFLTYSQAATQQIDSYFETSKNIPEMQVIDFLKGLFNAFKLVIIPLSTGEIYVNTLTGYYASGELLDISRYVDTSKLTVSRGNILSHINYNFVEPSTILNQAFEENNGVAYGDEELVLKDNNNELLQGDTVSISLPFETILLERLYDLTDGAETNVQYGTVTDRDRKTVNPKAFIHYNRSESVASKSVAFVNESGAKSELNTSMNIPSPSAYVGGIQQPPDVFLFSVEFSPWDNQAMTNTLYSKYHADYITDIFSPKRRNYTLRAILPLRILLSITLNDIVKIGSHYFRFDNFTINTLTGEAELKLFNSVNISFIGFSASPTNISLSKDAQTYTGYVFNLIPYTSQKIDVGFGTNWLTVTDTAVTSSIHFTVTENLGQNRTMQVRLISTTTLEEILFTVTQSLDNIGSTVDNTIITVDNSQITI